MLKNDVKNIVKKQREFFLTHKTKDIKFRLNNLIKLKNLIIENEENIFKALKMDLNKPSFESYVSEVGLFLEEIKIHIKKLKKWSKPKRVKTPLIQFKSTSFIYPEPFGVILIIAPWNYPFLLLMDPLIGAMSAGNCAVLKPANYSYNTSKIIEKIINENFPEEYLKVFTGGRDVNQALLEEKYDYIFFTGSPALGKEVMEIASKNLTPVTLELGGKSPGIVDKDANIDLAAKRLAWGKFFNAGQTCICPDYLFIHRDIKNKFLNKLKIYIKIFFGDNPSESPDFARIINEKHHERLLGLMKNSKIIIGGENDKKNRYIAPTVLDSITPKHPVMQEEIFGPILPIMEFSNINEVIDFINKNPKPLALYYFSENNKKQEEILNKTSSGGVCINDTLIHCSTAYLPFGGVGNSGMGNYHGKATFDTFTHYKSMLKKSTAFDIDLRYPPYKNKLNIIKKVLK